MKFKEFCQEFKGVRRSILAICIIWTSAAICIGLYVMLTRALSGPDSAFLTGVITLSQAPVVWYFQTRGKEDGKHDSAP